MVNNLYYQPLFAFCINKKETSLYENEININVTILFFYNNFQTNWNSIEEDYLNQFFESQHRHNGKKCCADKYFYLKFDNLELIFSDLYEYVQNLWHYLSIILQFMPYPLRNRFLNSIEEKFSVSEKEDPDYINIKNAIKWYVRKLMSGENIRNERNTQLYKLRKGNSIIKIFIELSAEISSNYFDEKGRNVLHNACLLFPPKMIKIFLKICKRKVINRRCQIYENRPLRYLLDNIQVDKNIVNLFFKKGAKIEYLTQADSEEKIKITKYEKILDNRKSLLKFFKRWMYPDETYDLKSLRQIPNLKKIINVEDRKRNSPLHMAARDTNDNIIKELIKQGAVVNAKNVYGRTPLHEAVSSELKVNVEHLLENGANVNELTEEGSTPLHFAKKYEIFDILLAYGADINTEDNNGEIPFSKVIFYERNTIQSNNLFLQITEYLIHMKHSKKFINPKLNWFMEDPRSEEIIKQFESHVEKWKEMKLNGTEISFYHILYCKNLNKFLNRFILKMLNQIRTEFFFASKRFLMKSLKDNSSKIFIFNQAFQLTLTSTNSNFSKLPYLCVKSIFKYLNEKDAMNLMKAFNSNN